MNGSILDYLFKHYDAVIIESFGVGGIPSYEDDSFHRAIERWVNAGKFVIMTTQVTNEGSNMSVYEIGKTIKKEFGLLEAYDMTLEATVTKPGYSVYNEVESIRTISGSHPRSDFPVLPEAVRGRTAFLIPSS